MDVSLVHPLRGEYMPETLDNIVKRLKAQGMSAIECQKWLRDNGYAIPWVETQKVYNRV